MRRKHDESYKLLFSLPVAVEDLVHRCLPRWASQLDFTTLEKLSTEQVGPALARRHVDLLWKVRLRKSRRFVVLMIEFQSRPEAHMATRILEYTGLAYRDLDRHGVTTPSGKLPVVIAMVIYNGRQRWTGPENVADLIDPVSDDLAAWVVRQRHCVLDLLRLDRQSTAGTDVVSLLARLERDASVETVLKVVEEVLATYPGSPHAELRRAFREWIIGAVEAWGFAEEVLARVNSLQEAGRMYATIKEEKRRMYATIEEEKRRMHAKIEEEKRRMHEEFEESKKRALREGRAEGRATLVCRQARRKFGGDTAKQLSMFLEGISDPDRIARIGDWILDCEDGADLLARAREV